MTLRTIGTALVWLALGCGDNAPGLGEDGAITPRLDGGIAVDDGATPTPDGGIIVPQGCGDGEVDPGEECDGAGDCGGDCRLLPCPTPGPCVGAARNASGTCVPFDLADGTTCEDRDACTAGDHCEAGACVGSPNRGRARLRGEVTTFGAAPELSSWNEGLAAFVADDRLVFLESNDYLASTLSLVEVGADGLTRVASAPTEIGYSYENGWVHRTSTHIVPFDASTFAVVGGPRPITGDLPAIELFAIDGDRLESRGVTPMAASVPIFGVAARADVLWACGAGQLQTYAFDAAADELTLLSQIDSTCRSLALSPDGTTLFVAEERVLGLGGGVLVHDVSGSPIPGAPANTQRPAICPGNGPGSSCRLFSGTSIELVQVSAEHLAILPINGFGEAGDLQVMPLTDVQGATTISHPTMTGAAPTAMALAGDQIFVEWVKWDPQKLGIMMRVAAHPLTGSGAFAEHIVRDSCCGRDRGTLMSLAARGDLAAPQPWRQVLRHDGAALTALTGREHGSLRGVVASAPGEVVALGPFASHRIDVSRADAPAIVAGGMILPPGASDLQLARTGPGAPARLLWSQRLVWNALEQGALRERFSLYDTSLGAAASIGDFWIAGENDHQTYLDVGGAIFQVRAVGATGLRVRRFLGDRGAGLRGQELTPDLAVTLDAAPVPGHTRVYLAAFGVSAIGDQLVFVEMFRQDGTANLTSVVTWVLVGPQGLEVVARSPVAGLDEAVQVVIAGDDALVGWWKGVARVHRDGAAVTLAATHTLVATPTVLNPWLARILAFDGQRALLSEHLWLTPPLDSQWVVEVLDADLAPVARYDTAEDVESVTVSGETLVFGMNSSLRLADPECR